MGRRKKREGKSRIKKVESKLKRKVIFLVIDGLADLPLNEKTPLSEAKKTNLDYLASLGLTGEIIPVKKKFWNELTRSSVSHLAVLSLLGYNPEKYYLKRGPLEAVGTNLPYTQGYLALRCNFATVDKDMVVVDRRVGRESFGLDELARSINEHVILPSKFIFMRTYEHRGVLILKEKLSDKISDSDPFYAGEKVRRIEALEPEAEKSAKLVQEFLDSAKQIIEYHPANEERLRRGLPPANCILTREAGNRLPKLENFLKKYKLGSALCIAENGCIKGLCLVAGMNALTVPELKFDSTLRFIFSSIRDALTGYDFIFAHIKGPDEPAHDGDFHKKRMFIEAIDKYLEMFRNFDGILVVTCDHITSCKTRKHEYGPVPLLVYGKGRDNVTNFNEFSVKKGGLGLITGKKLMEFIFKQ
ncbi:MAG: 2,3-bisphosphoglycerate-independent phosphoglycerate mutase [Candidatus Aenigmatarchaeota archaeon]